jgi:hypothetical protein
MNHNSVAKSVRLHKEAHPELYCSNPSCLYRTGGGDCPKHFREELAAIVAAKRAAKPQPVASIGRLVGGPLLIECWRRRKS